MNALVMTPLVARAPCAPASTSRRSSIRCAKDAPANTSVSRRQAFAAAALSAGLLVSRPAQAFSPTKNDEMMRRKEERLRMLRESAAKQKSGGGGGGGVSAPPTSAAEVQ